ncbi:helix-turn-helix domain-containing protein [Ornithinimicrobium sp. Arc0846-15]|nr:helix-turn-helix domain-containing protein [Ornithinimicrobium laminariae]
MAAQTTTALRVLAHPLRSRLLAHLRVHGDATASDLAAALGTNSGATSYHLRQLAEVNLIEDTLEGTGRRRLWRATPDQTRPDELDPVLDDDDASAADWLALDYLAHFSDQAHAWLKAKGDWPPEWQSSGLEDHLVQVTGEQLTAMRAEIDEVLQRYRRVGQGNPAAKRVVVYTCPLPLDNPPRQK